MHPNHYTTPRIFVAQESGQMVGGAEFLGMAPLIMDMTMRPSIDEIAHEVDHLVVLDQTGADWDKYQDYRTAPIIREQQAYYVGLEFGRYLLRNNIQLDNAHDADNLQRNVTEIGMLDAVRSAHLGPGPVFGVTKDMIADYSHANLLGAVYQAERT